MEVQIRWASKNDMLAVHGLIVELAVYEKEPKEVETTIEELQVDGFGPEPKFECLVLEKEEKVIGFALLYTAYSTWKGKALYLEDFLVTETERGKGYGKLIFDKVLSIAKERKVRRMAWQVLDWNKPAIDFYKKYDTYFSEEWLNCRIDPRNESF